jgi:SAM-dependent methyltransferase
VAAKRQDQQRREAEVLIGNAAGARRRNPLVRLLTDPQYTLRAMRFALNLPTRMDTEDRRLLEQTIFPYYNSLPTIRSVLFVGCDWYTRHYGREFFGSCDYWTIDVEERSRKFGSRQHVVDALENLDRHFDVQRFDLIVCNGVFGFGLDRKEQCERAFHHCHTRLKVDGHFLFGWTNVPVRVPVPLESIESLKLFQPFVFPPLGVSRYVTDTPYHHTYDFYRRTTGPAEGPVHPA